MYPQWNGEGEGDAREYQAGSSILLLLVIMQYTATALTLLCITTRNDVDSTVHDPSVLWDYNDSNYYNNSNDGN
jgi:hypothetical protein